MIIFYRAADFKEKGHLYASFILSLLHLPINYTGYEY